MPRKRNRIISRDTARAAKSSVPYTPQLPYFDLSVDDIKRQIPLSLPKDKETDTDRVFRIIYELAIRGYCFTEPETGTPWIRYDDIEDKGNGLFVIRFRCPTQHLHEAHFGLMANSVCNELNSDLNFFHTKKQEYGIPFEDCVWVLQKDSKKDNQEVPTQKELDQDPFETLEEFPDDFNDESTAEEIQARFDEAIENFL